MNKMTKIAAASALVLVSASSMAANYKAKVNIVDGLLVNYTQTIDFGNLESGTISTCAMDNVGVMSGSNSLCSGGDTSNLATFRITGSPANIVLSVATGAVVNGITFNPSIDGATTRALSGPEDVTVYGDLDLDGNQTAGATEILYDFTANYE